MTNPTPPADKPKKERLDPNIAQRQASDPRASVWVTASAGTGKTKVLTDRVLRLMLEGAAPEEILCLTFTKAGASVMTTRIREELANWATMDDAALDARLTKLEGRKPDDAKRDRARRLFAEFLDSHGGMRIQTIHSFSQSLIRRFPIESGVPPYFDVMDDQTAVDMLRESQADILRDVQSNPDTPIARAVRMITPEVGEDDFANLIGELTYRRGELISIFAKYGDLDKTVDAIYDYLKAPRGLDSKVMNEQLNSDQGLNGKAPDIEGLKAAADILATGSQADLEKAKIIKAWILHPEQRFDLFWDYTSVFLTNDGSMRKRLTTKATAAAQQTLEQEAKRLMEGIDAVSTMNLARGTEAILRLSGAILRKYNEKKRAANLLDYDDLVHYANIMMRKDNAAAWVIQKLPGNLKHILVDEAQDTNPDQWSLVSSIAQEFFKNSAKDHTLFVVGDEKQSIFSFQRADPREFGQQKKFFADLVKKAGGQWREVEMQIAFRSSPAITRVVDAVFNNPAASDGLFFRDEADGKKVKHNPFRRGQAGLVELHPILRGEDAKPETPWTLPLEMTGSEDPYHTLAEKIADQIKDWMDKGEKLESRGRPINPDDIMILVRRRSAFVDDMVRALKKRDIPVAGADRMSLREQIVVMDLVALGDVLLFPKDDYKLACVLKSPLIGMTDKHLEELSIGRTGDIWQALAAKAADPAADKSYKAAFDYLTQLQAGLNSERPYEFYSTVLMNACPANSKSGLSALYGRLGFEAEDPLVEFMNALERFEKIHIPSLQGFLAWLDAGEAEVKRDVNLNPESPRVHIMTVHGAKGLEAPIVILPDTTGIPSDNSRARAKFLWPDADRPVPLWVPRADLENDLFKRERALVELERDREFRRLLYVALTRAADRLYVYGADNSDSTPDASWYQLIKKGMMDGLADELAYIPPPANDNPPPQPLSAAFDDAAEKKDEAAVVKPAEDILRFSMLQSARTVPDGVQVKKKTRVVSIPEWARKNPSPVDGAITKFRPSDAAANDNHAAPSPLENGRDAYHRTLGTAIHQMLEFLPALPPEEREQAARRHMEKPSWGFDKKDSDAAVLQIMTILQDPSFSALFGAESRPEVSVTGFVMRDGKKQIMTGQIDRLVVEQDCVTIVDYKNGRNVPKTDQDIPFEYVAQMAAYKMALQEIYPGKKIRCTLLWTRAAKLMPVPDEMMDAALDKMALSPLKAAGPQGPKL